MKLSSIVASTLLTALAIFMYLNPKARSFINEWGGASQRTILASIETTTLRGPHPFKILKIKEGPELWLEVYFLITDEEGVPQNELHKKLNLRGAFDGHILIQERASNLAIANIDSDRDLEILAPTYDRSMSPILNIYKYDPILEEFKLLDPSQNPVF
ncbi:MAG: hypothetical protein M9899_00675 [Bdellovibrionaceae bacterium]|nr:hypothetical protein [Pseudobdellovibrionaceae bacterium]